MSRFAGLTDELTAKQPEPAKPAESTPAKSARRPARAGKKGILGYFSPELSRALNIMAIEEETSLQALMGEAFDLLLRNRGKHPFGER
jgi:hypothetical protein